MNTVEVKTNNQWREFVYGYELTDKEKAEFDYLEPEQLETRQFIRYKGALLDSGEFLAINHQRECLPEQFKGWHGYQSDSFFSGVLIRYSSDFDQYQIATYVS